MSDSEIPQEQETQAEETQSNEVPQDFSPGHNSKKKKIANIPVKQAAGFAAVAILFFAVGFLIPKGTASTTGMAIGPVMTSQDAGTKAVEYINSYLLQPGYSAKLVSANETNGIYSISINITSSQGSTIYPSYVTKDGKLLFVSSVDLSVTPKTDTNSAAQETQTVPKTDKPKVELFVMSFCPYGVQAEQAMAPVVDLLGSNADIKIRFIASAEGDDINSIQSLHGIVEGKEDARQLCVMNNYNASVYWNYLSAIDSDCYPLYRNETAYDACWKKAASDAGIDAAKIDSCTSSEGVSLIKVEEAAAGSYGVSGSPTLLINGVKVSVARTPEGYKAAICDAFNQPPSECNETLSATGSTASGNCG